MDFFSVFACMSVCVCNFLPLIISTVGVVRVGERRLVFGCGMDFFT